MACIEEIHATSAILDKELMVCIFNNLPKDHDVTMENLELGLDEIDNKAYMVKIICDKRCNKYERIKKHQPEEKIRQMLMLQ